MAVTDIAPAIRAFLEAEPWKRIGSDSALVFALNGADGRRRYAVLMAKKTGCSLVLCEDEQALSVYAQLMSARSRKADEMEIISLTLEQNSMELWLGPMEDQELNVWLDKFGVEAPEWSADTAAIIRREPARLPRPMNKEERERLAVALHAAVDYVVTHNGGEDVQSIKRLGDELRIPWAELADGKKFAWSQIEVGKDMAMEFPSPCLQDELALRRIMKKGSSGHDFICALRMLPMLLEENSGQVPCVMLMIDSELSMVGAPVAQDIEADASALAGEFLRYVEEFGKPARIRVCDPRSYCLLHGLSEQLGIRLEQTAALPQVDAAMKHFLTYMLNVVEQQEEPRKKPVEKKNKDNRGICVFCGREFAGERMQEHLAGCARKTNEPGETPYFLMRVTCPDEPDYWMYLEVKKDASLRQLDQFLRDRWLECCGHMSAFLVNDVEYYSYCDEPGMKGMGAKLDRLVEKGSSFLHQYDFGTPTDLVIEVVDEYTAKDRRKKVALAAQNIMPKHQCVRCGKPASRVARPGMEPVKESVFCEACAAKEESGTLPLMNSPRTGVCGYGMWMDEEE